MDLKELTPQSDVLEVTLRHPTTGEVLVNEDGTDMVIFRHAPHSKAYKAVINKETNRKIKSSQAKRNKITITAEELEETTLQLLAETTFDWNITYGGKKPKFSVQSARDMYEEVFWIKDQVEEAEADYMDFTKV